MTKLILNTLYDFKYNLDDANSDNVIEEATVDLLMDGVENVKKMIDGIITNNNYQAQLGTLTSDQQAFQARIKELKQAMKSVRLTKSEGNMINISLWDCDPATTDFSTITGCTFSDNLKEKMKQFDDFCTYLSDLMNVENTSAIRKDNVKECTQFQKFKKTAYVYWFNTSFGHLDQIRVDLEKSFNGEHKYIKTSDGANIDTMWIPAQVERPEHSPTVLF